MTRTCSDCPKPVTRSSKTGRCRACALRLMNRDAAFQERRRERLAEVVQDEGYKTRHRAGSKRGAVTRASDPIKRAELSRLGKTYGPTNIHPAMTPEARLNCAAKVQAAHLAWCPREHWPLNQMLKRAGYRLAERKAMIAEEVARAERRVARTTPAPDDGLTPFERQLARVAAGARLVAKPDFRTTDPAYSLVGNATGML